MGTGARPRPRPCRRIPARPCARLLRPSGARRARPGGTEQNLFVLFSPRTPPPRDLTKPRFCSVSGSCGRRVPPLTRRPPAPGGLRRPSRARAGAGRRRGSLPSRPYGAVGSLPPLALVPPPRSSFRGGAGPSPLAPTGRRVPSLPSPLGAGCRPPPPYPPAPQRGAGGKPRTESVALFDNRQRPAKLEQKFEFSTSFPHFEMVYPTEKSVDIANGNDGLHPEKAC